MSLVHVTKHQMFQAQNPINLPLQLPLEAVRNKILGLNRYVIRKKIRLKRKHELEEKLKMYKEELADINSNSGKL